MALLVDPPSRDSAGERPSAEVPSDAGQEGPIHIELYPRADPHSRKDVHREEILASILKA